MNRISIKIIGSSGQGLDSIGEVVSKSLKRSGYCVFGYREFPSLIKGGHASYQLDISDEHIASTETKVDIIIALNHHALELNLPDLKTNGIVIHSTPNWRFSDADAALIKKMKLSIVELPIEDALRRLGAKPILANVLLSAFVWAILGQDIDVMKKMVGERFAKKKDLLDLNMRCIEEGCLLKKEKPELTVALPKPQKKWKDYLYLSGSKAMGLGVAHAGVRLYAGYPMTPSSPMLSYIASIQNETGMVIKQAEDEITAAQIASGAMYMGTRAMTGTSGGGFDLMSETLSLNGIIENPSVFLLAQRPGPATGLPTWTAQGDLLMAVGTAHGEFPRCIISVSDSDDAFYLVNEAFNIAEKFQISVILMTDKQIAEAFYTQEPYDQKRIIIDRGSLITDPKKLKKLKGTDRYDPMAKDGISPRWLPGADAATYVAQGDEHSGDGTVDESAENAVLQMNKRMKKGVALKAVMPEPELYQVVGGEWVVDSKKSKEVDVLLVGWGSTKSAVMDAIKNYPLPTTYSSIGYLHYTHLWPLRTEKLEALSKKARKTILIEGNYLGQLGVLVRQECGLNITERILKYDGRPFFVDELQSLLHSHIAHAK